MDINESYLQDNILDSPVSSLKELQYWYGVLQAANKGYSVDYGIHLSPFGNAGEENSVLYCDFKQTNSGIQFQGITLRQYRVNDFEQHEKVMYCKYDASRGKEHSITQKSSKNPTKENVLSKVKNMLTWINEDAIQDYISSNTIQQDSVLLQLQDIADSDDKLTTILDRVESDLPDTLTECLVTVRIEQDGDWNRPGDYRDLIDAMKHRVFLKSNKKSSFDYLSTGEGLSIISEENETLVGAQEDSLGSFKTKQQSTFTNLVNDQSSWANNPVSLHDSLHIGLSDELIGNLYENIFSHRVYFLPYFTGKPTVKKSKRLLELCHQMAEDPIEGMIATDIINNQSEYTIQYYVIALHRRSALKDLMYIEPSLERPYILELTESYTGAVKKVAGEDSNLFSNVAGSKDKTTEIIEEENYLPTMYNLVLHNTSTDWNSYLYRNVLSGKWIKDAFYRTGEFEDGFNNSGSDDFKENDTRSRLYQSILENSSFSWSVLLEKFVQKVERYEKSKMKDNSSVVSQQILTHQLGLLQSLLDQNIVKRPSTNHTEQRFKTREIDINNMSDPAEDLQAAVDELPVSSPVYNYAFSVGALIGRLGSYQRSGRQMKKTIQTDHPISHMTGDRLREAVTEFADKASVYELYGYADQLNYIRNIQPSIEDVSYQDTKEIKYFYALGIAFGESNFYDTDS